MNGAYGRATCLLMVASLVPMLLNLSTASPSVAAMRGEMPQAEATKTTPSAETSAEPSKAVPESNPGFLGVQYTVGETERTLEVVAVVPGSPTDRAGLHAEDVIVRVNDTGFRFETYEQALDAFSWVREGDRLRLSIERGGEPRTLEVVASAMPESIRAARERARRSGPNRQNDLNRFARAAEAGETVQIDRLAGGSLALLLDGEALDSRVLDFVTKSYPNLSGPIQALETGEHLEVRLSFDPATRQIGARLTAP